MARLHGWARPAPALLLLLLHFATSAAAASVCSFDASADDACGAYEIARGGDAAGFTVVCRADGRVVWGLRGGGGGGALPASPIRVVRVDGWAVAEDAGNVRLGYAGLDDYATGFAVDRVLNGDGAGGRGSCRVEGRLTLVAGGGDVLVVLTFAPVAEGAGGTAVTPDATGRIAYTVSTDLPRVADGLMLEVTLDTGARSGGLYGMGEQFNYLDMWGHANIPIFTREQGVGRGLEPLTTVLNAAGNYAGGSLWTNYAARPLYATSSGRWWLQENAVYSEFVTTDPDQRGVVYRVNDTAMHGVAGAAGGTVIGAGTAAARPLQSAVAALTHYLGRIPPPPAWSYQGALVGMQGGTDYVLGNLTALLDAGTPIAGFWLQDWTGVRQLDLRQGLWWSWQWSDAHYPGYLDMIAMLKAKGIRTLTYVNPMVVNNTGQPGHDLTNFYATAVARGYVARRDDGSVWSGYNGAVCIDLYNPEARRWYRDEVVAGLLESGVSGWMADFGEGYPMRILTEDAGVKARHNAYPDEWFKLNREVVEAAGLGGEVFFFGRSAWLRSAGYYSAGWQGDQLANYDAFDGMATAVTSLLSAGISGTALTHSDIGGYNAILTYARSEELFYRWCELSAFTAYFRTHEGSDPHKNFQFYRTPDAVRRFARYARMYAAWRGLRASLIAEAVATGAPLARPLAYHFDDAALPVLRNLTTQYLVGADILVAPALAPRATSVRVYFPPATCWTLMWGTPGSVFANVSAAAAPDGLWRDVPAPLGCPAVLHACGSAVGVAVARNITAAVGGCA